MPLLRYQCVWFLARRFQAEQVSLFQIVSDLRTAPDVSKPVLVAFRHQLVEFLFCLSGGSAFQGHPFERLAPAIILDGDSLAVAPPEAANCVLAVIEDLGVSVSE